ncbi:LamG-like jellyroll fold domain-containing protein [Cellulomonas cellasea]|uniref:Uncharacterized protein n=1 Tax=Cellulomonas cellasea TaxID=43670 RepID=A0A7W4YC46_9CELL|nr:LamG-like jellyroll fold domain-containing protein [Cellulomonas cellasea]MBB2923754.1 hypothetical protein [Cellulomonas cellasea]
MEVLSERTEWNTTTALADGSFRVDASTSAVRARDGGRWAEIDNSIAASDGVLEVASAVTPMSFTDGSGSEPFATIERDGHVLSFDMPFDLPEPTVDGESLTYGDVLPGVDLVVTVNADATGFSEVLRVESEEAAADPRLKDLRFAVETSTGVAFEAAGGGFAATDAAGDTVFTSPTPAMWDSSSDVAAGEPDKALGMVDAEPSVEPVGDEEIVALPAEVSSEQVSIRPDADMLTDPDTVWPVYIDPGLSGTLNQHSAVRTGSFGIKYNFPGSEGVGFCDRAVSLSCDASFRSRLLWQFRDLQSLGDLDEGDITEATFSVTGTHSAPTNCSAQPVTLYAVADFDQSTAYPGGGYWAALDTKTVAHRLGCPAGSEPRLIEFNAIGQAQAVARAGTGLASFGIAVDESSLIYWKRYDENATFSYRYNRAPNPPTGLSTVTNAPLGCASGAARPWVRSTSVLLNAVLSDPDGTNVQGNFSVVNLTTGASWTAPTTGSQASGVQHSVAVPASFVATGNIYRWTVSATDGSKSGSSSGCEFVVDATPPVAPGVEAVTDVPGIAVYPRDGVVGSGGGGQEGRFRFSNGGSTDVVSYQYTFLGAASATTVPGQTVVAFVPTLAGSNVLTVKAVDAAGNVGPATTYRFLVAFPTMSDAWMLDESTGTYAGNLMPSGAGALTVSASTAHVNGPGRDLAVTAGAADRALRFDAVGDTAASSGPVVATDKDYAVMAYVKLDDLDGDYTAVSQDGSQVSAFELGYRNSSSCPAVTNGHCWAFSVPGSDSATAPSTVYSAVPAQVGSWVLLTAVREQSTISISACVAGTRSAPEPFKAGPAPARWLSSGALQVGRGQAAGAAARSWHGSVSQVMTFRDMTSTNPGESTAAGYFLNKARRMCSLPWSLSTPSVRDAELDAGDGNIELVSSGAFTGCAPGLILVETMLDEDPYGWNYCFKTSGARGFLPVNIPHTFLLRGGDKPVEATALLPGRLQKTYAVAANRYVAVDPGEGSEMPQATLVELRFGPW